MTDDKLQSNDTQEYTEEAQRHAQKIAENYRKLLDKATAPERYVETEEPRSSYIAPVYDEPLPAAPEYERYEAPQEENYAYAAPAGEEYTENYLTADNAARISGYTAHPAPKTKKVLFEGVTYTKGGYIHGPGATAVYSQPVVEYTAPVVENAAPAAVEIPVLGQDMAPGAELCDESAEQTADDVPTARTMLHRTVTEDAELTGLKTGFWSMLSTKVRFALAAVTTTIFIAVALICINTAILDNLNADIANKQMRLTELRRSAGELQEQIDATTDPANVDQWALEHGMIR